MICRLALALLAILLLERAALAYIDPGSGSYYLQMVLGGFAGLGVLLRLLWRRITRKRNRTP